ncbi:MAG: alpha/beta hydrolase [Gemmatimonadota bacterium]|nr:alpha/beta hydrolase [Gemmatimonadota bacterium]
MPAETYEAEGFEVPVETWGSAGDTLVFLPGLGCAPAEYRRGLETAARDFRIVVPDLSFRNRPRLPTSIDEYLAVVTSLTDRVAPGAPWAGHSFGGLLALIHPGPAVACAPSVPARIAFPRTVGRAVRLQLREYLGFEGRAAVPYALRTTRDYVTRAVLRPRGLFSITSALNVEPDRRPPRCERAVVYLSTEDALYRRREYEAYLRNGDRSRMVVRHVEEGHDWPITHGERLAERFDEALDLLGAEDADQNGPICRSANDTVSRRNDSSSSS